MRIISPSQTFMMQQFSETRLCRKSEPERGCLARCKTVAPPKNSCPMLNLPPEVRAQIFEYLICCEPLRFTLDGQDGSAPYQQTLPNSRHNLAFLEACRLFEYEALALVRVKSIGIDALHVNTTDPSKSDYRTQGILRTTRALSLGHVRGHVEEVIISSNYALETVLVRRILQSFPKLKTIIIHQDIYHEPFHRRFSTALERDEKDARQQLIICSLLNRTCCSWCPAGLDGEEAQNTGKQLSHLLNRLNYPRQVNTFIRTTIRPWTNRYSDVLDDEPSYPVTKAISAVRTTYTWPAKKLASLQIEYYNQPMSLAVKSKWIHCIPVHEKQPDEEMIDQG